MAKTVEMTERERETLQEILRELRAMPPERMLTPDELLSIISRMPKMPEGWTSADIIREMRGPLPEDDPDFRRNILGRR